MKTARRQHECARIKRFGHDYIVAIGGTDQSGATVPTIEFYDLTAKPSDWEVGSKYLIVRHSRQLDYIQFIRNI